MDTPSMSQGVREHRYHFRGTGPWGSRPPFTATGATSGGSFLPGSMFLRWQNSFRGLENESALVGRSRRRCSASVANRHLSGSLQAASRLTGGTTNSLENAGAGVLQRLSPAPSNGGFARQP